MAIGREKTETKEVLILIGALTGLGILLASAVTDLAVHTASELGRLEYSIRP